MPEPGVAADPLLEVRGLHAFYGKSHVLNGVELTVAAGEIVALLGRNGAGRSTTLKAIMGEVSAHGNVRFASEPIAGLPNHAIARRGIAIVPEGRDVFPGLTVEENLLLGLKHPRGAGRQRVAAMLTLFPELTPRVGTRAGVLSGGEQQMLAIARALMGEPRLVLMDEPTEGLAPHVAARVGALIATIARGGVAVLLVEQTLSRALALAHRVLVMGHGAVVWNGTPDSFSRSDDIRRTWLEV